jgi:hypothetical protein
MATLLARQLTEAHRLAQVRLGAQTAALVAATFPLLNPDDLTGSFPTWLQVVSPIVQAQRAKSSGLAAGYLSTFRTLELGEDFDPILAGDVADEALATSMLVTGPIAIRSRLGAGFDLARTLDMSMAGAAAAGMRHALNGGRETIVETVRADHRARGYERVTSGAACDFCEELAGRGAVYSEDSADFESHDHCSCSAEPVYA